MKNFLYLYKRDKKGVILLLSFEGQKISKTYLNDFEDLDLESTFKEKLKSYYYPLRFDWQIVVESNENFDNIKIDLHKKGFKNIQFDNAPLFSLHQKLNFKNFEKMPKKMLQKKNI